MMKAALAIAALLVACTDAPPAEIVEALPTHGSSSPATTTTSGAISASPATPATVTVLADREGAVTLLDHASNATVDLADSPCACTTPECVNQWIEDNIGCDIAVDFVCPGGIQRAGLVRCTEQPLHLGR